MEKADCCLTATSHSHLYELHPGFWETTSPVEMLELQVCYRTGL